jgi:hypothetical protein
VFDVLDRAGGSVRPLDLPEPTGMSKTQVYEAITRLVDHGLVDRGYGWVQRTRRTLTAVAVDHGVEHLRAERVARHRAERRERHTLLAAWAGDTAIDCPDAELLVEKIPQDPWRPEDRAAYLTAIMATGPPPTTGQPAGWPPDWAPDAGQRGHSTIEDALRHADQTARGTRAHDDQLTRIPRRDREERSTSVLPPT